MDIPPDLNKPCYRHKYCLEFGDKVAGKGLSTEVILQPRETKLASLTGKAVIFLFKF
jgi:hypothetical protein